MRSHFLLALFLVVTVTGARAGDKPVERPDIVRISSVQDGLLAVVGAEVRRWKKGDRVERGDLLARLDDRLARVDVEIVETKISGLEEEVLFAQKKVEEANARYKASVRLRRSEAAEDKDVAWAELNFEKAKAEVMSTKVALKVGKLDLKKAQIVLEMYHIHSPYRGVIQEIYKHSGEAVRAFEPVFLIEIARE